MRIHVTGTQTDTDTIRQRLTRAYLAQPRTDLGSPATVVRDDSPAGRAAVTVARDLGWKVDRGGAADVTLRL